MLKCVVMGIYTMLAMYFGIEYMGDYIEGLLTHPNVSFSEMTKNDGFLLLSFFVCGLIWVMLSLASYISVLVANWGN